MCKTIMLGEEINPLGLNKLLNSYTAMLEKRSKGIIKPITILRWGEFICVEAYDFYSDDLLVLNVKKTEQLLDLIEFSLLDGTFIDYKNNFPSNFMEFYNRNSKETEDYNKFVILQKSLNFHITWYSCFLTLLDEDNLKENIFNTDYTPILTHLKRGSRPANYLLNSLVTDDELLKSILFSDDPITYSLFKSDSSDMYKLFEKLKEDSVIVFKRVLGIHTDFVKIYIKNADSEDFVKAYKSEYVNMLLSLIFLIDLLIQIYPSDIFFKQSKVNCINILKLHFKFDYAS